MGRLLLLLSVLFVLFTGFKPGKPAKRSLTLHCDSSAVRVRHYDGVALQRYSREAEFQYHETAPAESWWDRFWRWFWHLFDGVHFNGGSIIFVILKYLLFALGLAALVFAILRIAGVDISGIFRKKPVSGDVEYSESLENIHEINFDAELERAIARHNYRLAVRLLYLKCLKQLNDLDLIKWESNKTNSEYVNELAGKEQGGTFEMLTRQFEYVWYGEFLIDTHVFQQINEMFQDFKYRLK